MLSNAIFFALGAIASPLILSVFKVLYVLATGKKWLTQADLHRQKDRIKISSTLRLKNLRIDELRSECNNQHKLFLSTRQDLAELVEENLSLTNQISALKQENQKLTEGLESLLQRLESAERKLGR